MSQKIFLRIGALFLICFSLFSFNAIVFASQSPIANAGADQYVTSGMFNSNPSVILQGSGYNPDGGAVSFYWACTGGNLSNNYVLQPLFTVPSGMWQSTAYNCTLTATNNYGLSFSDSMTVYVNYNNNINNYNISVQTNNATNNYNGQAILNGTITGANNTYGITYTWFQWGTTSSYGRESSRQPLASNGSLDQHIADLLPGTIYHFRIVAQKYDGTLIYGQDVTLLTPGYSTGYIPPPIFNNSGTGQVAGASTISTGLTNDFLTDSFFLPMALIILSSWLYFSGNIYRFADWLRVKII